MASMPCLDQPGGLSWVSLIVSTHIDAAFALSPVSRKGGQRLPPLVGEGHQVAISSSEAPQHPPTSLHHETQLEANLEATTQA